MILGVTPARGGSKEIPKKNIKEIAGKPLLAWTIESANQAVSLDRYLVSTEDQEIAECARQWGAEIMVRPSKLASDNTSTLSVLRHVLESIPADIVVLLQATSPIRMPGLIDECVREFIEGKYDSLATGFYCRYREYGTCTLRRQDIHGFFYDDGNVYVMRADLLRKGGRVGKKIGRKVLSRLENIEIDDDFDFWIAERVLSSEQIVSGLCH